MQRKDISITHTMEKDYRTLYHYYETRQTRLREEANTHKMKHHRIVQNELRELFIHKSKPSYRLIESLIEVADGTYAPCWKKDQNMYQITQAVNNLRIELHRFLYEM